MLIRITEVTYELGWKKDATIKVPPSMSLPQLATLISKGCRFYKNAHVNNIVITYEILSAPNEKPLTTVRKEMELEENAAYYDGEDNLYLTPADALRELEAFVQWAGRAREYRDDYIRENRVIFI